MQAQIEDSIVRLRVLIAEAHTLNGQLEGKRSRRVPPMADVDPEGQWGQSLGLRPQ